MKKNRYSLFVALALVLLVSGCTKFLDTVPDERTQLNSIDKVKALLTSAYPQSSFAALVHFRCDYVSDLGATVNGSQPMSLLSFAGDQFIWKEQTETSNDREEAFWTDCYSAIAATNHALEALDNLQMKDSEAAYGEAYMARAFSHFYLVSLFSELYNPTNASLFPGIPYVTEPEEKPIEKYERSTVADTYEKIEKDFEAGFAHITDGSGFYAPKYHFSKTSACAFGTRFYLMKGDYGNVVKYANMVFPSPTSFITITDGEGKELENSDGSPVVNVASSDAAITFATTNFHPVTASYTNMGSAYSIMDKFVSSANPGNLLLCEQVTSLGLTYLSYYSRFAATQKDATELFMANLGVNGDCSYLAITYSQDNRWFIPKFPYQIKKESVAATSGLPYSIMPLLRMEEILLNRAEAYVMLDQYDKAIADMNVFLSQRSVVDIATPSSRIYDNKSIYLSKDSALAATTSDRTSTSFINQYNETSNWPELKKALIVMLLRYRAIEFWQEGLRWYDIRRWNIPVRHVMVSGESNQLAPGDGRRLLQIPESALLSGLEKNDRHNVDDVWK